MKANFWYVRIKDARGHSRSQAHPDPGRQPLPARKIPQAVEVSPYANGDFRLLRAYTEFQEVTDKQARAKLSKEKQTRVAAEDAEPAGAGHNFWIWLAALGGVAIIGVVAVTLFFYLPELSRPSSGERLDMTMVGTIIHGLLKADGTLGLGLVAALARRAGCA